MTDNTLFYFVFLSQIILISYYFPRKIMNRMKVIMKTYPSSDYPKLYPVSPEQNRMWLKVFKVMNQFILFAGFIFILVIGRWDFSSEGEIDQIIPFGFCVFQLLPFMLMELSGFAYFKLMRRLNKRTKRQADLNPRNLFSFISPAIVGFAVLTNVLCVLFYLYLEQFQFGFGDSAFVILVTLILSNSLFAVIIFKNLQGKKLDPHQSSEDRSTAISITVKSLVFMSIGGSVFLILIGGVEKFSFDYLEASMMSLYWQFVMLMNLGSLRQKFKLESINFNVYKEDVSAV